MKFIRPRVQVPAGAGLLITAAMLAWPVGRPSYEALEEWGNLLVPWWWWPLACIVVGLLLLLARRPRATVFALALGAFLYFVLGAGVYLSVGPAVAVGPVFAVVVPCLQAAVDLRRAARGSA